MAFKMEGTFRGKILATMLAESRFAKEDPNAFDVCLQLQGPEGQSDWWRGEMSKKYGKGNFASKTQAQITMENLHRIGFEGIDLSKLDAQLVGKEIEYTVVSREYVKDGVTKTAFEVKYIGESDFGPKKLDASAVASRMAALGLNMAGASAAAATTSAAAAGGEDSWY